MKEVPASTPEVLAKQITNKHEVWRLQGKANCPGSVLNSDLDWLVAFEHSPGQLLALHCQRWPRRHDEEFAERLEPRIALRSNMDMRWLDCGAHNMQKPSKSQWSHNETRACEIKSPEGTKKYPSIAGR